MERTDQIAGAGRRPDGARAPLLTWVVGGVALLLVAGCIHLIFSVTSNQNEIARHGRWLQDAGEYRRLLEEVADAADENRDEDPATFHDQIPARLKRELTEQELLRSLPLEDAGAVTDEWRQSTIPLRTAMSWLLQDEGVRVDVVAEPARELADAVARTLPKAAAGLTQRSEELDGERSWLLAVAGLIALGSSLLAVMNLRLRSSRDALVVFSGALRENEERYRQMFEQNNGIKLLISPYDGRIVEANQSACEFYGGAHDDLQALRMPNIVASRQSAHELMSITEESQQTTLLMQHKLLDKSLRDVEMHVSPITVHGNKLLYAILHDVTDKLAMEKEMRRAEQLESLGVLAGGIAHDFNNFLASMIGNLQLAQLDVEPRTNVAEALTAADGACRRAQNLARQLLTFTKGGTPVRNPTSLEDLIKQTVKFALRGTPAGCELDIAPDLAPADVDEGQINQVLHNLVINANQAMPSGGSIRVRAANYEVSEGDGAPLRPGRYVHIRVEDDGVGIAPDDLDRIFEPYFTTKKAGSGLGLATSYSIVRKHEGSLTVESTVGAGTTFHVLLPVSTAPAQAAPVRPSPATAGGERVLWLEDDPQIGSFVERMLRRYGYGVEVHADGSDVVRRYAEALESGPPFDLVVLDLTVPGGMGGRATVARLLELDPNVRAVVCSGYQSDDVFVNYREHGFSAALGKPFDLEQLASVLIDVLDSRRASEAA